MKIMDLLYKFVSVIFVHLDLSSPCIIINKKLKKMNIPHIFNVISIILKLFNSFMLQVVLSSYFFWYRNAFIKNLVLESAGSTILLNGIKKLWKNISFGRFLKQLSLYN